MLCTSSVYVRVTDHTRQPLTNATVRLSDPTRKDVSIDLKWDERIGLYRCDVPLPGEYILQVSARALEMQQRAVKLPAPTTPFEFILGKQGMPFYYRGRVKTPFEPKLDLVALTFHPGRQDTEDAIREIMEKFGLSEEEVGEQIRANHVRVFRYSPDISEQAKQDALEAMLHSDAIPLAGPVVELFEDRVVYLTSQLVAKFTSNISREQADIIARRHGLRVVQPVPYAGNAYLLQADPKADYSLLETAQALVETDPVEYAEPNSVTTSIFYAVNPADFLVGQQWHIPLIGLPDAWQTLRNENPVGVTPGTAGDLTYGSEDIVLTVFDAGIESNTVAGVTTAAQPDFSGNVTSGSPKVATLYDFGLMQQNNDTPLGDHGMGCAGVATAVADNASSVAGEIEGVAGAAGNCRVIGAIGPFGYPDKRWADAFVWMAGFDPQWTADGITYPLGTVFPSLLSKGTDVFTVSIRVPDVGLLDDTLDFLATYARGGKGALSFLAAGNTAAPISHPANNTIADHDKVIAVAASINTDVRSGYSCYDPAIDVCAPSNGDGAQTMAGAPGIVTCDLVGGGNLAGHTGGGLDYRDNFGGTSSATPLAAGVAALMLTIRPELTWIQIRELLRDTAQEIDAANTDPIGQWITNMAGDPVFSQWYGYGRVDAAAAVVAVRDYDALADVVVRDNLADTGAVPSGGWHANSPDIWVRRANDPIPTLAYTAAPPHESPVRGQDNYVFLRVKNVGTAATNEVYLRALITHFPGFEFRYPQEWIPSAPPSLTPPSPLALGTYLIGAEMIDNLAPGANTIIKIRWDQTLIPPTSVVVGGITAHWHPCLLAEVSPHDGPEPAGTTFDVRRYNDLAQKNISIEDPDFSPSFSAAAVIAGTADTIGVDALIIDRSMLPADARVFIYADHHRLMRSWTELVKGNRVVAVDPLPISPLRPDESPHPAPPSLYPDRASGCSITLIDPARLLVECCGKCGVIIHAPAQSRIQPVCLTPYRGSPEVSIGNIGTQEVIYFNGGSRALELPMRLAGSEFVTLVLGIQRSERGTGSVLKATQRRADGELSVGYEVRA